MRVYGREFGLGLRVWALRRVLGLGILRVQGDSGEFGGVRFAEWLLCQDDSRISQMSNHLRRPCNMCFVVLL